MKPRDSRCYDTAIRSLAECFDRAVPAAEFERCCHDLERAAADLPRADRITSARAARRLLQPRLLPGSIARRAIRKPRGYAGDYLLMQMIYEGPDRKADPLTRRLDELCCSLPVARAGFNRISFLRSLLERESHRNPERPLRIASLGCGPAQELVGLSAPAEITLLDQDDAALSFCRRRMTGALRTRRTEAREFLTRPDALRHEIGQFDVLYSVGLFDYLEDPFARALLQGLASFVAPGGLLVIGNLAPHDATAFMTDILDWGLVYRDRDQLMQLWPDSGGSEARASVDLLSEPLGLNLFLTMRLAGEQRHPARGTRDVELTQPRIEPTTTDANP